MSSTSDRDGATPARLLRLVDRGIRIGVDLCLWVACGAMILLTAIGSVDVVGTFLFSRPLPSAREFSEVLLSLVIFAGMALATREGKHVRIDLFTAGGSPRTQALLRWLALLAAAAVFAILAWRAWNLAWASYLIREAAVATILFPVWPFKILVASLMTVTAAECLRQLARGPRAPVTAGPAAATHS